MISVIVEQKEAHVYQSSLSTFQAKALNSLRICEKCLTVLGTWIVYHLFITFYINIIRGLHFVITQLCTVHGIITDVIMQLLVDFTHI